MSNPSVFRVLVVDNSKTRRKSFAAALARTGWDVCCVGPETAHAAAQALEPHATLVAYPRAAEGSVGALLRTRAVLTVVPPATVERLVRGDPAPSFAELVRAAAA